MPPSLRPEQLPDDDDPEEEDELEMLAHESSLHAEELGEGCIFHG
jgi:hypothetical protein